MQFDRDVLRKSWFLSGPTASGKTDVGLILAERLAAEVVSLDSMTLYRGMDIGTAKPSPAERARVPHHLFDILDPSEEYSLAEYVSAAQSVCSEIVSRGKTPLFIGGTGLYLRGVLRGVFAGPPADWELRKRLEQCGPDELMQRLREVDPESAQRLHANDTRRVVRALEVYEVTGKPISAQQQQPPLPIAERPPNVYWLLPERELLYDNINRRVERMIEAGLVEEVRRLLERERPLSRTARQALGYKEMIAHLEEGQSLAETIQQIQMRTRQFAKRQHTWFRNLEECEAVEIGSTDSAEEIAERMLNLVA